MPSFASVPAAAGAGTDRWRWLMLATVLLLGEVSQRVEGVECWNCAVIPTFGLHKCRGKSQCRKGCTIGRGQGLGNSVDFRLCTEQLRPYEIPPGAPEPPPPTPDTPSPEATNSTNIDSDARDLDLGVPVQLGCRKQWVYKNDVVENWGWDVIPSWAMITLNLVPTRVMIDVCHCGRHLCNEDLPPPDPESLQLPVIHEAPPTTPGPPTQAPPPSWLGRATPPNGIGHFKEEENDDGNQTTIVAVVAVIGVLVAGSAIYAFVKRKHRANRADKNSKNFKNGTESEDPNITSASTTKIFNDELQKNNFTGVGQENTQVKPDLVIMP